MYTLWYKNKSDNYDEQWEKWYGNDTASAADALAQQLKLSRMYGDHHWKLVYVAT